MSRAIGLSCHGSISIGIIRLMKTFIAVGVVLTLASLAQAGQILEIPAVASSHSDTQSRPVLSKSSHHHYTVRSFNLVCPPLALLFRQAEL
jgi:hypothetical protein